MSSPARKMKHTFAFASDKKKWKVYTLKGCGACQKTKDLLKSKGVSYVEIDGPSNVDLWKNELKGREYNYYPKIFNPQGEFIGGYQELSSLL